MFVGDEIAILGEKKSTMEVGAEPCRLVPPLELNCTGWKTKQREKESSSSVRSFVSRGQQSDLVSGHYGERHCTRIGGRGQARWPIFEDLDIHCYLTPVILQISNNEDQKDYLVEDNRSTALNLINLILSWFGFKSLVLSCSSWSAVLPLLYV